MVGYNTTAKLSCGGLLHGPGDDPAPVGIFDHHHLDVRVVVAPIELYKGGEVYTSMWCYKVTLGIGTLLLNNKSVVPELVGHSIKHMQLDNDPKPCERVAGKSWADELGSKTWCDNYLDSSCYSRSG